jgi:hypothetical protein
MKAEMMFIVFCLSVVLFNDFALAKPAEQSVFKEAKVLFTKDQLDRVEKNRAIDCPSETGHAGKKCITVYSITDMMFNMAKSNSELRLLEMLPESEREKEAYQQKTASENKLPWGDKKGTNQYVLWDVFSKVVLGQAPDNFLYFPYDEGYLTKLASAVTGTRTDARPANAPASPPAPKPASASNADPELKALQAKISALQAEIAKANSHHSADKAKINAFQKQLSALAKHVDDLIRGQTILANDQNKLTGSLAELTEALTFVNDEFNVLEERITNETDDKLVNMAEVIEWRLLVIIISFSTVATLVIVFVVWTRQGNKKRTQEAFGKAEEAYTKVNDLESDVNEYLGLNNLIIENKDELSKEKTSEMQVGQRIVAKIRIKKAGEEVPIVIIFEKTDLQTVSAVGIKRTDSDDTNSLVLKPNSDFIRVIKKAFTSGRLVGAVDSSVLANG